MGEFDIIQPIMETIDRRGASFELGRAGANTSAEGAYLEGYDVGFANTTRLRTAQLEAQRKYDPIVLAEEDYQRELNTRILEQSKIQAEETNRILLATGMNKANQELARLQAATRSQDATARKAEEAIRVSQLTAIPESNALIAQRLQSANASMQQALLAQHKLNIGKEFDRSERELDLDKTRSEIIERLGKVIEPTRGSGSSKKGSKDDGISFFPSSYYNLENKPQGTKPSPQDTTTSQVIQGQTSVDSDFQSIFNQQLYKLDQSTQNLERSTQDYRNRRQVSDNEFINKQQLKDTTNLELAQQYGQQIVDTSDVDNVVPSIDPLSKVISAYNTATTQEDKATIQNTLRDAISSKGGSKQLLDSIKRDFKDPELRKQAENLAHTAIAITNPDELPSTQRDIFNGLEGLPMTDRLDSMKNPEQTYNDIQKVVAGNSNEVENTRFSGLIMNSPYTTALAVASNYGTQKVRIGNSYAQGTNNTESDTVGSGGNEPVIMFRGEDGTIKHAPIPDVGTQEHNLFNMVSKSNALMNAKLETQADASKRIEDVEQRTLGIQERVDTLKKEQGIGEETPDVVSTDKELDQADVISKKPTPTPTQEPVGASTEIDVPPSGEALTRLIRTYTHPATFMDMTNVVAERTIPGERDADGKINATKDQATYIRNVAKEEFGQIQEDLKARKEELTEFNKKVPKLDKYLSTLKDINTDLTNNKEFEHLLVESSNFDKMITGLLNYLPNARSLTDEKKNIFLSKLKILEGAGMAQAIQDGFSARTLDTNVEADRALAYAINKGAGKEGLMQLLNMATVATDIEKANISMYNTANKLKLTNDALEELKSGYFDPESKIHMQYIDDGSGKLVKNDAYVPINEYLAKSPIVYAGEIHKGAQPEDTSWQKRIAAERQLSSIPPTTEKKKDTEVKQETQSTLEPPPESTTSQISTTPTTPTTPTEGVGAEGAGTDVAGTEGTAKSNEELVNEIKNQNPNVSKDKVSTQIASLDKIGANLGKGMEVLKAFYAKAVDTVNGNIENKKANLVLERSKKDPEFQKTVEMMKKEMGGVGEFKAWSHNIFNSMTFGYFDELVNIANPVKAHIEDFKKWYDPEKYEVKKEAFSQLKQDVVLSEPTLAFLGELIAVGSVTGAITKGSAMGLLKASEKIPGLLPVIKSRFSQFLGRASAGGTADIGAVASKTEEGIGGITTGDIKLALTSNLAGEALGSALGGLTKLFTRPDPATATAKLFAKNGISRKSILEAFDKAAKIPLKEGEEPLKNVLAHFNPDQQDVLRTVLETPEGVRAVRANFNIREQQIKEARESVESLTKGMGEGSSEKIQTEVGKALGVEDKALLEATEVAEGKLGKQQQAVLDLSKDVEKDVNKALEDTGKILNETYKPVAVDVGDTPRSTINELRKVHKTLNATIKGDDSMFKVLGKKYANSFKENVADGLQTELLSTAEKAGGNVLTVVRNALEGVPTAGAIDVTKRVSEDTIATSTPKFFFELIHQLKKMSGGESPTITKDQANVMKDVAIKWFNKGAKEANLPVEDYGNLMTVYGNTKDVMSKVEFYEDIYKKIDQTLSGRSKGSIHKSVFSSSDIRDKAYDILGEDGVKRLESALNAYDDVSDTLKDLNKQLDKPITKTQINKLSEDLQRSVKLVGSSATLGGKLIKVGNEEATKSLSKSLGKEGKELISGSIMESLNNRLKDFNVTNKNTAFNVDAFLPGEILGLSNAEWENAKLLLPEDTVKLMDHVLEDTKSINNFKDLFTRSGSIKDKQRPMIKDHTFRQAWYTRAVSLIDLVSSNLFNKMDKTTRKVIVNQLTKTDYKDVNKFIKETADKIIDINVGGFDQAVDLPPDRIRDIVSDIVGAYPVYLRGKVEATKAQRERKANG